MRTVVTASTAGARTDADAKAPPGRRKRDAVGARRTILAAARRHFVDSGYEGARVDEIAAETGFSKNLIYHYYRSKEGLFAAVLDDLYERFLSRRNEFRFASLPPAEALGAFVGETVRALVDMPEIIGLLNSENLQKAVHVRRSKNVRTLYRSLLAQLAEILARGEAAGEFRPGIDPVQLYISISSLMYHYLSNQHTLSAVFAAPLGRPAALKARRAHVAEMILRFCLRPERVPSIDPMTGRM